MTKGLNTDYQKFIATSRYSRWLPEELRRETWKETVRRYVSNVVPESMPYVELEQAIVDLEVMPSMRGLMTAGPAMHRDNTSLYNCAYTPVEKITDFDKSMFILLCGTGVGFSVERQYTSKLPDVPKLLEPTSDPVVVGDSKEGWAMSLRQIITLLYDGYEPTWDVSKVRPAGARLNTFGGRASGPGPLVELFSFVVAKFKAAKGRKLSSIECHDIMCKIGEVVVSGGVRRSAMISLSNLSDNRMRSAKSGQWYLTEGQRALANNSVSYTEKPDMLSFLTEWASLIASKSGERGIFNREASVNQVLKTGRRDPNWDFGTNPCSEIILRPRQFCNLTEAVIRREDTLEDIERKVRLASILGTIQSQYTYFPYLGEEWEANTKEERLLGVSLTGIMDNPLMTLANAGLSSTLEHLKSIVVDTNKEYAELLGIPQSTATTCVKPSGTVSQLVDSASGIHPRHSEYYIRTVRGSKGDPMTDFMVASGIPSEPCVMKPETTMVFSFPVKAPNEAVVRNKVSALKQLELWLTYQRHWCEHKPSVTITVKDAEWLEVGDFVYKHFDEMSGVSFLPYSDHTYQQAPYQEVSEEEYTKLLGVMPESLDWSTLSEYEVEDTTKGTSTFACSGDSCELVDLS